MEREKSLDFKRKSNSPRHQLAKSMPGGKVQLWQQRTEFYILQKCSKH